MRGHTTYWRDLALAAALETNVAGEEPLPHSRSNDLEDWNCLIDGLSDRVLWDADYDMAASSWMQTPRQARPGCVRWGSTRTTSWLSLLTRPRTSLTKRRP